MHETSGETWNLTFHTHFLILPFLDSRYRRQRESASARRPESLSARVSRTASTWDNSVGMSALRRTSKAFSASPRSRSSSASAAAATPSRGFSSQTASQTDNARSRLPCRMKSQTAVSRNCLSSLFTATCSPFPVPYISAVCRERPSP